MKMIVICILASFFCVPTTYSSSYGHLKKGKYNSIYKFDLRKKGKDKADFSAKIHNFEKNTQLKCMKGSYYIDGPIFVYDKLPQNAGSKVGKDEKASEILKKYPSASSVTLTKKSSCGNKCTIYTNDTFKVRVRNGEVRSVDYFDAKLSVSPNVSDLVCRIFGEKPYNIADNGSLDKYGNWCGLGNNGKPQIDGVDEVCMVHDQCYDSKGRDHCNCDVDFVKRMPNASASGPTGEAYRAAAILVIGKKPCFCKVSWDSLCCSLRGCRTCRESMKVWSTALSGGC